MIPIIPIIFVSFSSMLLVSALMVVVAREAVKSALYLVLAFFAAAGLWMLLSAEFLSLILLLVYVGAVMTLFLFVIMTLRVNTEPLAAWRGHLRQGLLVLAIMLGLMIYLWHYTQAIVPAIVTASEPAVSNTVAIGRVLYTDYFYAFEAAGVLLLVAMVAAIALSWHVDRRRRVQDVSAQVRVTKAERLKIIKGSDL